MIKVLKLALSLMELSVIILVFNKCLVRFKMLLFKRKVPMFSKIPKEMNYMHTFF